MLLLPTAHCLLPQMRTHISLPICSSLHHHMLKRRLTPAECECAAFMQRSYGCAALSSDGKFIETRAEPKVLFAA